LAHNVKEIATPEMLLHLLRGSPGCVVCDSTLKAREFVLDPEVLHCGVSLSCERFQMAESRTYPAIFFKQRQNAPLQLAFVASSRDINAWARVPTKKTGNVRNFQRAEIPMHIEEVHRFFKNEDNSSPTAVVVGFDPIRATNRVRTMNEQGKALNESDVEPGRVVIGKVEITWLAQQESETKQKIISTISEEYRTLEDYIFRELIEITGKRLTTTSLRRLADAFYQHVANEDLPDPNGDDKSTDELGEDSQSSDAAEEQVDELPSDLSTELQGLSPSPKQVVLGRLRFLSKLRPDMLAETPERALRDLYKEVSDELKPGILIDGQHRIMGTQEFENVPFLVTALPTAGWPELAFQFLVTNRTARRVAESLLISIVGQSLSKEQREEIEERLREANIRVGLIEAVMKAHEEEQSPFYNMLAFGIRNEPGFIDAAAMQGKVIQMWYERKPPVRELFDHMCEGKSANDRTEYWKSEEKWFDLFITFWSAVKERYEGTNVFSSELVDKNKKAPSSKLMTATVLKIFQETLLDFLLQHLRQKHATEGMRISESVPDAGTFSKLVLRTLERLTPEFFTEWKLTGFDGSKGARDDLEDAIRKVISTEKTVSQLKLGKYPHRLFRAEE
jgi:hypothetical protein